MAAVTVVDVRIQPSGVVLIDWSDNTQDEYRSIEHCKECHFDLLDDDAGLKHAKRMMTARGLIPGPGPGNNLVSLVGKSANYVRAQAAGNIVRIV
ncbi:MAG: hypothetical protein ACKO0Z_04320 [Betaproteobacteria bacterium]